MKILYISSRYPFPPIGGHKLRVYNFVKYLSLNHDVTLFCLISPIDKGGLHLELSDDQMKVRNRIKLRVQRNSTLSASFGILKAISPNALPLQFNMFRSKKIEGFLAKHQAEEENDLIIFHLARMGQFSHVFKRGIKVLDIVDALVPAYTSTYMKNRNLSSIIKRMEAPKLRSWEQSNLSSAFQRCIVASSRDKDYYLTASLDMNIGVVPNGVDLDYFQFKDKNNSVDDHSLLFIGSFRHKANCDGVLYFATKVLPNIVRRIPEIKLDIVGLSPPLSIKNLESDNISVFGDVEDVRPFVYRATLSICPVRFGAGIQNKILESMAMGTPVVTSQFGFAGIDAIAGKEIVVSDISDDKGFARDIITLLKYSKMRKSIASEARKRVELIYNWESIIGNFICSLSEAPLSNGSLSESDKGSYTL